MPDEYDHSLEDAIVEDTLHGVFCGQCGAVMDVYIHDIPDDWTPGDCLEGERELCDAGRMRLQARMAKAVRRG